MREQRDGRAVLSQATHRGTPPWTLCDRGRSPGSRVDASVRPSRGFRLSGIDGRGSPFTVAGAAPELRDPTGPRAPHSLLAPDHRSRRTAEWSSYGKRLEPGSKGKLPTAMTRSGRGEVRGQKCDGVAAAVLVRASRRRRHETPWPLKQNRRTLLAC